MRQLVATAQANAVATPEGIKACLDQPGQGIWLDIEAPDDADYELLSQTFGFHELNRDDGGHRRFILIESGAGDDRFCQDLTVERLRRVVSGRWQSGPVSGTGGGFEVRVLR